MSAYNVFEPFNAEVTVVRRAIRVRGKLFLESDHSRWVFESPCRTVVFSLADGETLGFCRLKMRFDNREVVIADGEDPGDCLLRATESFLRLFKATGIIFQQEKTDERREVR